MHKKIKKMQGHEAITAGHCVPEISKNNAFKNGSTKKSPRS
jgi:hypothetical protein